MQSAAACKHRMTFLACPIRSARLRATSPSPRYKLRPMQIDTLDALRRLYPAAKGRAVLKQLPQLDPHARNFIALSPFLVLATAAADGAMDASPRGGAPGFVRVDDRNQLLIPDAPGNNRLDSLENIIATRRVGLLFMIPGIDETLRVNGSAALSAAPSGLDACADERRRPKLVIRVTVQAAYLHCAKAFMRSRLWHDDSRIDRARLPSMGQMLNDQTGGDAPFESQQAMAARYAADL